jgi:hypothetical protein
MSNISCKVGGHKKSSGACCSFAAASCVVVSVEMKNVGSLVSDGTGK